MALREAAVRRGRIAEHGLTDDATAPPTAARPRRRSTRSSDCRGSHRSCARTAGSCSCTPRPPTCPSSSTGDLVGDLHSHGRPDGRHTVEEMARAAQERGPEYLAITDHSASHGFRQPRHARRPAPPIEHVREVNAGLDFELLVGTETNIGLDGAPDYDDDLLAELDWVIGSVHTSFGMGSETMTRRMVAAVEHPLIDAIGHPTGRKIETRAPMPSTWTRSSTRPPARGR